VQVFRQRATADALELVSRLLEYTPSLRLSPIDATAHHYFDELRDPATRLPPGRELPPLFNFTAAGRHARTHTRPSPSAQTVRNSVTGVSRPLVLNCGTTLHPDYGGRG